MPHSKCLIKKNSCSTEFWSLAPEYLPIYQFLTLFSSPAAPQKKAEARGSSSWRSSEHWGIQKRGIWWGRPWLPACIWFQLIAQLTHHVSCAQGLRPQLSGATEQVGVHRTKSTRPLPVYSAPIMLSPTQQTSSFQMGSSHLCLGDICGNRESHRAWLPAANWFVQAADRRMCTAPTED